ncbi:hypothetical protein, variant [Verruconis gallopava]|uniref:ELYS-like domain-containing protein n=1 Tax=Verruconis gallopava TaxID=253628 RepID=A0A0D1XFE1_9PEZI|nr:hypothetical protein, variant [Verruconis gallopava]KIW00926.1 hypothetical protein, variant [Verruconis gallopava]
MIGTIIRTYSLHVEPRIYPPKNNRELRQLHQAIIASKASEDQKLALLYYLLKNVGASCHGKDVAEDFASEVVISRRSWTFIEGIWELDHLHYAQALEIFASVSLPQNLAEELLDILLDLQKGEIAVALYQTVNPSFSNPKVLQKYFTLICQCSIADAYSFMHHQEDPSLFEILLAQALSGQGPERARNCVELIDLPFTAEEEEKMYDFYLHGPGRNLPNAADVVVMRKIATGKLSEVESDVRRLNVTKTPHDGMTWDNIVNSIGRGMGPRSNLPHLLD